VTAMERGRDVWGWPRLPGRRTPHAAGGRGGAPAVGILAASVAACAGPEPESVSPVPVVRQRIDRDPLIDLVEELRHLAVMRRDVDPDPADRLSMGEYDLFAPDGSFLGRLPLGLSPGWFDGERLVATVWDEFLVPSMVVYRVR